MTPEPDLLHLITRGDIIDVRSPSEFALDHIPGALNLPVLDDAERARIGTIYKRVSRFEARRQGAVLVARNVARHIETTLAGRDGSFAPLVYCWRGGMRSAAMAHVLRQVGWRAELLEGGYRAYRRALVARLYEAPLGLPLVVLAGPTGTAKTSLLARVKARGGQVIDLEALARHRGSLFGDHAGQRQPSQKGFETALFAEISGLDPARPVLIEDESSKIGNLLLPPTLWSALCTAPRISIDAPVEARAGYLVRAYADIVRDPERLSRVLESLVRLCGRDRVEAWQDLAASQRFEELASDLMRGHYDPAYARSVARHPVCRIARIPLGAMDEGDLEQASADILAAMTEARLPVPASRGGASGA